jgi:hypothetical protein
MMFKVLLIEAANALSDERTEFLIKRPAVVHAVPGAEPLGEHSRRAHDLAVSRKAGQGPERSGRCLSGIARSGLNAMGVRIVDASLVAAPKQFTKAKPKADETVAPADIAIPRVRLPGPCLNRPRSASFAVGTPATPQPLQAPIRQRSVPAADGGQLRRLLDEPVRRRLGQCGLGQRIVSNRSTSRERRR